MRKSLITIFRIFNIPLLLVAMSMMVYNGINDSFKGLPLTFVLFCALSCATLYCLYGYKKGAAKYYKIFMYLYAISKMLMIPFAIADGMIVDVIVCAVICGAIFIISAALDLGIKKSVLLGLFVLIVESAVLIFAIASNMPINVIFGYASCVVLASILNLMILAKYQDKSARGTK